MSIRLRKDDKWLILAMIIMLIIMFNYLLAVVITFHDTPVRVHP